MSKIVGLLVGRENTFPGPFIETVNRKGAAQGVSAELAVLGGTRELQRASGLHLAGFSSLCGRDLFQGWWGYLAEYPSVVCLEEIRAKTNWRNGGSYSDNSVNHVAGTGRLF